jgi:ABC-type antimicrobial peptide transport system permease subunit
MSAVGLVALLLAAIGLYGVMTALVRDETREIGIRMALGATAAAVRRGVLRRAMILAVAGAGAGVVVALIASRALTSLLFEVRTCACDDVFLSMATSASARRRRRHPEHCA